MKLFSGALAAMKPENYRTHLINRNRDEGIQINSYRYNQTRINETNCSMFTGLEI